MYFYRTTPSPLTEGNYEQWVGPRPCTDGGRGQDPIQRPPGSVTAKVKLSFFFFSFVELLAYSKQLLTKKAFNLSANCLLSNILRFIVNNFEHVWGGGSV